MQQTLARVDETPARADEHRKPKMAVGVVIAIGFVVQLAWRLWLARGVVAPAGHPDEDGYLIAARVLTGGPGGYSTENEEFRRVGYPLLLTPAYWWPGDAFAIFHRAQVISALFGAAVFPLAALFARRVLGTPTRWAVGAGFAAATLPGVTFYSNLAMTDAVLPALFLGWVVLGHGWLAADTRGRRWAYAVASGALAGFIYTVHVRGTMVLAAHLFLMLIAVLARRVTFGPVLGSIVAAGALKSLNNVLLARIGDEIHLLGVSPGSQLGTALTVDWGIVTVVTRIVGQFWAMGVGTLGLGLVGLLAAVAGIGDVRRRQARALTLLAVLVATGLIAAGSAVSLPFADHRLTYFAYPRYLHFLYPVWLLVGLAAARTASRRRRIQAVTATAALMVFSAAVVGLHVADLPPTPFIAFDAVESTLLSWQWSRLDLVGPTIVAIALCGLLVTAIGRSEKARPTASGKAMAAAALVVLVLLGGVGAEVTRERVTMPMVGPQYASDTPKLVRDLKLGPGDTVAEAWQVRFPDLFNHMREVDWAPIVFFDANVPPPPQATVVIAPWDPSGRGPSWDGRSWGMAFVAGAPRQGWAVWRRTMT
ncbi:hypothetical protein [Virgisporangium aurantiacum]|nr:hypothetical protein [Virgisporangium aurantiacum]